jgi:hypothetical protein
MKHAILAVIALIVIAWLGSLVGLDYLFGVVFPILAFFIFLGGFIYRVVGWAKSPVPFRIPTTSGQGKSLDWVKQDKLDCPATFWQVVGRMLLEVFAFRSLFKNTKAEIHDGPKLVYGSSKWLWLFGLAFHYCFLLIVLRHLRLFLNPVPEFIGTLEFFDGLFQVGVPVCRNLPVPAQSSHPAGSLYLFCSRLFPPVFDLCYRSNRHPDALFHQG